MKINILKNKKIAILGYGVTGQEVHEALKDDYAITIINDKQVENVNTITADQFIAQKCDVDIIIKSPGVPYSNRLLQKNDHYVLNDIELAYLYIKENNLQTKIVAITGTNGKTTTTSLINDILNINAKSFVCGNIGTSPLTVLAENQDVDYLVMELSSYQLKQVDKFTPDYGLFLNISPDHIDYHGNFEDYLKSKCNLFINMDKSQKLVLDKQLTLDYPHIKWPPFATCGVSKTLQKKIQTLVMPMQNIKLIFDLLLQMGVDEQLVIKSLNEFKGLEHRLEIVDSEYDFKIINDSKATNVNATNAAIGNLNCPTTLIVGGSVKVEQYNKLDYTNQHLKNIICYGAARHKFDFIPGAHFFESFESAVKFGLSITKDGELLLLSPACASFDQHENYVKRGEQFKKIIGGK